MIRAAVYVLRKIRVDYVFENHVRFNNVDELFLFLVLFLCNWHQDAALYKQSLNILGCDCDAKRFADFFVYTSSNTRKDFVQPRCSVVTAKSAYNGVNFQDPALLVELLDEVYNGTFNVDVLWNKNLYCTAKFAQLLRTVMTQLFDNALCDRLNDLRGRFLRYVVHLRLRFFEDVINRSF